MNLQAHRYIVQTSLNSYEFSEGNLFVKRLIKNFMMALRAKEIRKLPNNSAELKCRLPLEATNGKNLFVKLFKSLAAPAGEVVFRVYFTLLSNKTKPKLFVKSFTKNFKMALRAKEIRK